MIGVLPKIFLILYFIVFIFVIIALVQSRKHYYKGKKYNLNPWFILPFMHKEPIGKSWAHRFWLSLTVSLIVFIVAIGLGAIESGRL